MRTLTPIRSLVHWAWALGLAIGCVGCTGYHLGPTQNRKAGEKSVRVLPFQNNTLEPRLVDAVANSIRKNLQQDGTFRLETRGEGDITLTGVITVFQRSYLSFDPKDVITPRDYELTAITQIRAVERATSKVLVDRQIGGRTTVRVGADVNSAERQAIPILAEMLARKAVSVLADGGW